ncbi:uncharacterized protein DS421_6g191980 [Arachis hypogaea]|nr:uncharacterized protein DS421_6g191980 [Arachis hypogaea]
MLQERLILGQFGGKHSGSSKKSAGKHKAEDRGLRSSEGHFRNGILDVRHLLNSAPSTSSVLFCRVSTNKRYPRDHDTGMSSKWNKRGGKGKQGKKGGGGSFGEERKNERSPRKRRRKEAVKLCLRLMCMDSHCFSVSLTLSLSHRHSSPHCLCARREARLCLRCRRSPLSRRQNASVFEPSLSLSSTTLCEVRMYMCCIGLFAVAVSSSILVVPQHLRRRREFFNPRPSHFLLSCFVF